VPRAGRRAAGDLWPPPRKRLGQHFLTDPNALRGIVDALAPTTADTVLEIGAGRGALTSLLAARAGRVRAVELDRVLAARLAATHADDPRVEVVEGDILDRPMAEAAGTDDFLVAGNVPYYITTPILFHALRAPRPRRAVFLVQREVAERVVAAPGTAAYGALSVNVQALAAPTLVFGVAPRAFVPPPTVDSAVLRVVPRPDPVVSDAEQERFASFVIAAFGLRRKQMRRVLRTLLPLSAGEADRVLAAVGVVPESRPEVLDAGQFAALWRLTTPRA
jgi:16S rRNA (adenine1518-N6/adenine1519-N6)-dimethyltransferase